MTDTAQKVANAFKRIENRLIDSMIRNLSMHRAEEAKEGLNWAQWQAIQLQELERYREENGQLFDGDFEEINRRVEEAIRKEYGKAGTAKEAGILKRIKDRLFPGRAKQDMQGEFFGINRGKVGALIDAVENDFQTAEQALLRRANDVYRQTIFDAQVMAASGMTYEEAVDMATKDFLRKGIDCIEYSNGARHSIEEYAAMAIRTAQKRAYLMGLGQELDEAGIHTVRVNKRTDACPLCVGWLGKVLVDDVYANGTAQEAREAGVPLLSEAMNLGFLHPNCRDVYSIYIPGISRPANPWTKEEIQEIADKYNGDQKLQHAERMAESYGRMAKYSLAPENKRRYAARAEEWKERTDTLKSIDGIPATLEPKDKGGLNIYTTKEIETMSSKAYTIVSSYIGEGSLYSGKTVVTTKIDGPPAWKEWNCDIVTMPSTSMHFLIHEHIHAHSISHYDEAYYRRYRIQEEGAVELLAIEISKREGFITRQSESYKTYVEDLRKKRKRCKQFDSDLDFALELIKQRPEDRDKWIGQIITDSKK